VSIFSLKGQRSRSPDIKKPPEMTRRPISPKRAASQSIAHKAYDDKRCKSGLSVKILNRQVLLLYAHSSVDRFISCQQWADVFLRLFLIRR